MRANPWKEKLQDPRRQHAMKVRAQVERGIREFFESQGFLETRTPLLVPCPGMEPHIRPMELALGAEGAARRFLPTSPEFAMKRLLVGGMEKIFQICPAFRDEPPSTTHRPEFTMLEWYRAHADHLKIMQDTERLIASLAHKLFGKEQLSYQGQMISVAPPWPRLRVRDLFLQHAGIDLTQAADSASLASACTRLGIKATPQEEWDDLYFKIWLNVVEGCLPKDRAVFVCDYPPSQAALAVISPDPDGTPWARRFETYAGGLELGNAFQELTDAKEQRKRFIKDMQLRSSLYGPSFPPSPLDEDFLAALEAGLPPSGGNAMGVDRLVMLFADETDIAYTFWLGGA